MKAHVVIFFLLLSCLQNGHASILSWWEMNPQEVREKINQRIMSIEAPVPMVASVMDDQVVHENRKTPIRIYTPAKGENFPVILLVHGGAWIAGNLDTHDNMARYLCSETQAIVVSVGYSNAPEGKFPLPLEQCYDTVLWITEHAHEFSADVSRLAIVGDSAGGNMTAALCLMLRDRSGPNINLQVLINPAPDLTCNGTIKRQNDALDTLRWQAFQYLSDPNDTTHPYVSPLVAKDLSGLPPSMIILAEKDDLREAGQKYADRLRASGVPTEVYCQKGINHLAGDGARASLRARESLDVAIAALQKAFSNQMSVQEEDMSDKKALMQAAKHYVTLLDKIGASQSDCPSEEIMTLCTKNCKKVRNGKLLFEGSEHFADQLNSGKEWLGTWSIDVQELLISTDDRTATIHYNLYTEKEGDLVVIVILHFDSNALIHEINEVHNHLER